MPADSERTGADGGAVPLVAQPRITPAPLRISNKSVRGLRGDGRDERFAQIDLRATAAAGLVLIVVLIVSWLTEIARGRSGSPYDWLCAIGGLAYLLAIVLFRWRG
jgi:hypothetical protein